MGRAPCCDKANVKKGPWSPEEDAKLKSYIEQHGTGGNWIALPQKIGLKRCGKSCRLRWLNYLRPNIKHGGFSEEEDSIICSLYVSIGSRWSVIAAQLPGRTDNDIKNYWNTRLKKKLLGKHRKEQQQVVRNNKGNNGLVKQENTQQLQTYWPPFPSPTPLQYTNQITTNDDQDGIRKLLIKLGGRFSDDNYQPILLDDALNLQASSSLTHQLNNNNIIGSSSSINSINQFCAEEGGQASFTGEILVNSSNNYAPSAHNKYGGLEFLYGEEMITDQIMGGATSNWGETSAMMFSPLNVASNYDCNNVLFKS